MLLSLQVSSAQSWIDAGLEVDTVIGHSFGQLAALIVAGSISLQDGFRFVAGRARLIHSNWGPEQGAMLSVESDRSKLDTILDLVNSTSGLRVDVACYNSPQNFVLAGDGASVDKAEELCRFWRLRAIRLQNTHAYHSRLTDAILPELRVVAESITIRPPRMRIETCTASGTWTQYTAEELVQHTRQPVYFGNAVERIASRIPAAVWLEAGSASPIIPMARRVVTAGRQPGQSSDVFIPVELGGRDSATSLSMATCQLWKAGSVSQHWHFCRPYHRQYSNVILPPYQFDKTRHWIDYKHRSTEAATTRLSQKAPRSAELVELVSGGGHSSLESVFVVNTCTALFQLATSGHVVAGQALCPASMYLEMAARCAMSLRDGSPQMFPHIEELVMSAPLGLSSGFTVLLSLSKKSNHEDSWNFTVFSQPSSAGSNRVEDSATQHAKGSISLSHVGDTIVCARLKLLNKLFRSSRVDRIINLPAASGIQGPMVYTLFSNVVDYAKYYRGVNSLYVHENEAAGLVTLPTDIPVGLDAGICDPLALDNFLQVAGIHVNCLSQRRDGQVFMCTAVEEVILSPNFRGNRRSGSPVARRVYTRYEITSDVEMTNDICVYDAESSELVVAIIGARFRGVPFKSLEKSLARLNGSAAEFDERPAPIPTGSSSPSELHSHDSGYQTRSSSPHLNGCERKMAFTTGSGPNATVRVASRNQAPTLSKQQSGSAIKLLCEMLSTIIEIPVDAIRPTTTLDELGVDSLLATEVLAEMRKRFQVKITQAELQRCTDVRCLAKLLQPSEPQLDQEMDNDYDSGVEGLSPDDNCGATSAEPLQQDGNLAVVGLECFVNAKSSYDLHADKTGFSGFCTEVYPLQSQLVTQYVVTAFASLGCDLEALNPGNNIPSFQFDPKHTKLVPQLYGILQDADLIVQGDAGFVRTGVRVPTITAPSLHREMLAQFPKHTSETKLLHTTASKLAECLTGAEDPIGLIFRDAQARSLLEDVYTNAPMFKTGTLLLTEYLSSVLTRLAGSGRVIHILELGAGTGGTSKHVVESLASLSPECAFTYTFTDLSSSLVAAAKRKFARWSSVMRYSTMDIQEEPAEHLLEAYDIIISTNCIHATRNLVQSTTNIRKMLRQDGVLCLVELTRNLFWFDLVFGLLEGWWLFDDGREHALAHEERWMGDLRKAGFNWIDWSNTATSESDILRLITASPSAMKSPEQPQSQALVFNSVPRRDETCEKFIRRQTVKYKTTQDADLLADIYYPPAGSVHEGKSLPVGERMCLPLVSVFSH